MDRIELQPEQLEHFLSQRERQPVKIEEIALLGSQTTGAAALKGLGYGRPLRVTYSAPDKHKQVVIRRINKNEFGRETEPDRVEEVWRNFHTFNRLPQHVRAYDMIGVGRDGRLQSMGDVAELYLLTEYASGRPYAEDLAIIRDVGIFTSLDIKRAISLARYLADIHAVKHDDPILWRRRLRDLVGHGEGVMGLTDSYRLSEAPFSFTSEEELREIETAVNQWRWQLKPRYHRLSQVHGDFHPFNILFQNGTQFTLLDRSRGEWGDPADDVCCLMINYLFFSLQRSDGLAEPFFSLYRVFWETYLAQSGDEELLAGAAPWIAWRTLVLASPQWYPTLDEPTRRRLLNLARNVLADDVFDWQQINRYLS
ncbi:MAG TPA: aminoglycoside phosphotransferase family protein [Anaerolineae bacterium]|nr:aminoglycoside phosphotransferase family protein [Anaerolineae bacterium]